MSEQTQTRVLATFTASAHATEEDFAGVIDAELARAKALVDQGVIVHGYHRTDVVGAALIVDAASLDEAHAIFGTLPAVAAGLVEVEAIMPLIPLQLPQA